jgi:DNA gyrase subunit A
MADERIVPISLHQEMQRSYLEYAMSVIVGRALPDVRDGLKPVQRRILYAMHELGLTPDRPYRKCARVVGDVLGKYHPHGDQAVYDALVRQVQTFGCRHPLLDGHGNFGSVDDDPPAAMRYTETRLAPISHQGMLEEIGDDTVDFAPNFDGSQQEPTVLPAQLPFLLLNGCTGIAVGMATSIPPHNLGEVVDALVALTRNPELSDEKLLELIPGPDFPSGGVVLTGSGVRDTYLNGRGSIPMRGVAHVEEVQPGKGRHKRNAVVITELPYQLSKAGWIEKLAEQVNDGKVAGIADIRDESDREGMRVVVELRRDANPEQVLTELHKRTALQSNFGAILLALVNGQPLQLSLRQLLMQFLEYRELTMVRRTRYALRRCEERLEVVEGLIKALDALADDSGRPRRSHRTGQPAGEA